MDSELKKQSGRQKMNWSGLMKKNKRAIKCPERKRVIILTERGRIHWHKNNLRNYCNGSRLEVKFPNQKINPSI